MNHEMNPVSLDQLCAALAYAMGVDAPEKAAPADPRLVEYVDQALGGEKADRLIMFNPDAISNWVHDKYPQLLKEVRSRTDIQLPYSCVMPSVTPVCFGTMYTGAQPEVHGIQAYVKPVITIETLFDTLLRAGKRVALVAETDCSVAKIFLEREMDYFIYDTDEEINAKAAELILKDEHDVIIIYNGNYDTIMHKFGTESVEALGELRCNSETYGMVDALVQSHWQQHRTLLGFAMDHGSHDIDGNCGAHGLYMPEDINIVHMYKAYNKKA